jgi:hypothetical protein
MKLLLAYPPSELRVSDELRRARELYERGDEESFEQCVDVAFDHAEAEAAALDEPSSIVEWSTAW